MDKEGKVHGRLDPPLSNDGKQKAKMIAHRFKSKAVGMIHSSPRQRAVYLAQELSKSTGAPMTIHAELIPWDLGGLSGAKVASVRPLLEYFSSHPNKPLPGAEAKQDVLTRYKKFFRQVKAGDIVVGHSQHSLALEHVRKGGDMAKVPMFGGKAGEIKEIEV